MRTAFIGHREVAWWFKRERLVEAVEEQIKLGCKHFMMGTHGDFDKLALEVCRNARKTHPDIKIEVVVTGYSAAKKKNKYGELIYEDVDTVMFDIEDEYYKRRITLSNKKMIDSCDTLICFFDKKWWAKGTRTAVNYAKRQGLNVINVFRETDSPMYGMTDEQAKAYLTKRFAEGMEKLRRANRKPIKPSENILE